MLTKELKDIALPWTEEEYRADPALSYSTLATYERGGFHSLNTLFDKKESPSLLFGSVVDCILTDGESVFNERFAVMDYNITDGGINVCKELANRYKEHFKEFKNIPEVLVSQTAQEVGFWKDPKWNNRRYKEVLNTGDVDIYYQILTNSDKIVISPQLYAEALSAVDALRTSEATKFYFEQDNPFDDSIKRYYQLKFKATLDNIDYRCMMDLAVCDYKNKVIYPCDLKTSNHYESEFYKSFIDWNYQIQARLYWRILRDCMNKDEYFKDFELKDYTFIVVKKDSLVPLTWKFEDTQKKGTLRYGKKLDIELRDPETIGKELTYYLNNDCKVPIGISITESNDIVKYLNTKM
jgi:hypothetical protein